MEGVKDRYDVVGGSLIAATCSDVDAVAPLLIFNREAASSAIADHSTCLVNNRYNGTSFQSRIFDKTGSSARQLAATSCA
jgi:hypothetical protein